LEYEIIFFHYQDPQEWPDTIFCERNGQAFIYISLIFI